MKLPTLPTQAPSRGLPFTRGSLSIGALRILARPLGDSASPAMSGTTFERSRMRPLASMIPGFSRPRGPKRTSFMDQVLLGLSDQTIEGARIMRRMYARGKVARRGVLRVTNGPCHASNASRCGISATQGNYRAPLVRFRRRNVCMVIPASSGSRRAPSITRAPQGTRVGDAGDAPSAWRRLRVLIDGWGVRRGWRRPAPYALAFAQNAPGNWPPSISRF